MQRLLDFLGCPDEKLIKNTKKKERKGARKSGEGAKKTKGAKGKRRSRGKSDKDDDKDDDMTETDSEEEREGKIEKAGKDEEPKPMPNDEALKDWVKAYISCFNINKATTNHAIGIAEDKFGVDLSEKKALIKKLLTDEMMIYLHENI